MNYITDEDYANGVVGDNKRHKTITKLNFFCENTVYTGKWEVDYITTKQHVGFKLGALTKTRKPYYFRSKKKKNVTKKNTVF